MAFLIKNLLTVYLYAFGRNKRILLMFFLGMFSDFTLHAQQLSCFFEWQNDSTVNVKFHGINYEKPLLTNLSIVQFNQKKSITVFQKDSILLTKGINHFKSSFSINPSFDSGHDSVVLFKVLQKAVDTDKRAIQSKTYRLQLPEKKSTSYQISDSAIHFLNISSGENFLEFDIYFSDSLSISKDKNSLNDSLSEKLSFRLLNDSLLTVRQLIADRPFSERLIIFKFSAEEETPLRDTLYYQEGRLFPNHSTSISADSNNQEEDKGNSFIELDGSVSVESNFFNHKPQHSNGSQYPYTTINVHNRLRILGMPFQLNLNHSTNDNLSPDFRNFFSFRFDVNQYRNDLRKELLEKAKEKQYSLVELREDISKNEAALKQLAHVKALLLQYPDDSLLIENEIGREIKLIEETKRSDSLFGLDSLFGDSVLNISEKKPKPDSSMNTNLLSIARVEKAMHLLKQSKLKKEKYLHYIKKNPLPDMQNELREDEIYRQLPEGHPAAFLARFDRIELGNFYQYAGEYSIRDIEMKGLNASFQLNDDNKVGLLHGKINDFQSFNLDRIEEEKRVSSGFISNQHYSFFQPSLRISRFADQSINPEQSQTSKSYYLFTAKAQGEMGEFLFYDAEFNQSNQNLFQADQQNNNDNNLRNKAFYTSIGISPFHYLDVNFRYDQVGSDFKSDGVYFLARNRQTFSAGYKLRLFKNKIYLKNDLTVINRNFEDKVVSNQTKKFYFDIGSRFKRFPNFQLTYSPITVDIANKIDTAFSGIDANTSVLIGRIFYFKKIRKTLYNTALIYSEIRNDFSESFVTQKGFQHFMSVGNEKLTFSLTSSYRDLFRSLRFLSLAYNQTLNRKLSADLSLIKNFADDFYSAISRMNMNYKLLKNMQFGIGGILLVESASGRINTGGSLKMSYIY